MVVLTKLLLAHFIGDFLLQPNSWVKEKEKLKMGSIRFYLHILIHGVLVFLLLWNLTPWLLAILIMVSHGTVDFIKQYAQKEDNKSLWFLIDQLLHIVTIVLVWFLVFKPQLNFAGWFEDSTFWVYAAAILFITIVSGILMREVMSKWSKSLNGSNSESLENAGKYIGILERLFVFVFVVSGRWEGIGFLLAAKSVFRFGDLKESKDRKLTEYILIGTLLSFGIAVAVGLLVLFVV